MTLKISNLTERSLVRLSAVVARRDPALRPVHHELGPPKLWKRPATFATFVRIILEQQVSLQSAKATFDRCRDACGGTVTAKQILRQSESGLRSVGFSRQKARYTMMLADDIRSRRFSISSLGKQTDDQVRAQVTSRLGLGNWSADVYLLMALLREDVLPIGDLALVKGLQEIDNREELGDASWVLGRTEMWRPYRSVGVRMVWQSYLHRRGQAIP